MIRTPPSDRRYLPDTHPGYDRGFPGIVPIFDSTQMQPTRPETRESPYKNRTSLQSIWNASRHSFAGFAAALRHEHAFRLELALAALLIPTALLLPVDGVGQAALIGSVLLLLIVELVNSAIEATVDRISLEHHRLAKRAKDLGSAAVMIAVVNLVAVWGLVVFG